MSLSKFYKNNAGFKARAILDSITSAGNDPVWESIVKEEIIPEIEPDTTVEEKSIPSDTTAQVQEENGLEATVPALDTVPESPQRELPDPALPKSPPPPAAPSIDVEAIKREALLEGITEGRRQAEEDFSNSSQTLINICQELDHLRETILRNSTEEMKELVLGISEKIIRHSVTEQHDTIVDTIKDAIHHAVQSDAFQIRLHPDDLKAIETRKNEIIAEISNLDNIVLKGDPSIEQGGCLLESSCCTVDASMTSQIKVIQDAIMDDESLIKTSDPQ